MRKKVLGEKNPETLNAKCWIVRCLYKKQHLDNAEKMPRDVESIRKEVLGEKPTDTLNAKYQIVMCLYKIQKFDYAKICIAMYKVCEKEFYERITLRFNTLSSKYLIAVC